MLHLALIALLAAHGADTSTTMYALGARPGQVREWNPAARWLTGHPAAFGAAKMATTAAADWYLLKAHEKHPRIAMVSALLGTAAAGAIAVHNARVTRH